MAIIEELHIDISGAVNAFERLSIAIKDTKKEMESLGLQVGAPEWQPIETCPKEGFFLVCSALPIDYDCTVAVVCNNRDGTFGNYLPEDADDHLPYIDGPPTHWMPLPNPPEA